MTDGKMEQTLPNNFGIEYGDSDLAIFDFQPVTLPLMSENECSIDFPNNR